MNLMIARKYEFIKIIGDIFYFKPNPTMFIPNGH